MILYAVMAEVSVVRMFVAGLFPGLLGGFALALACYLIAKRAASRSSSASSCAAWLAPRARRAGR
jgi:TRAP-type C4-dicarboxylate transport system permease large subunit